MTYYPKNEATHIRHDLLNKAECRSGVSVTPTRTTRHLNINHVRRETICMAVIERQDLQQQHNFLLFAAVHIPSF